jgi:uncharacterized membrane protein
MIKKICIVFFLLLSFPLLSFSQNTVSDKEPTESFKARVLYVLNEKTIAREDGAHATLQRLQLIGLDGEWKNKEFVFDGIAADADTKIRYKKNDTVLVLHETNIDGKDSFYITDIFRVNELFLLAAIFVVIICAIGGLRGVRALLGLVFSFFIILSFIIPGILREGNPLVISLGYSCLIVLVATYLVYGFNKKSSISIVGMFFGTAIVGVLSVFFTGLCRLSGFAEEETMYLVGLTNGTINIEGILLAGFIIGALGVLDDLAVSQVSTVQELSRANPELSRFEIYKSAMVVGVDHISSMVNTLFLAYAGASLPLLLLFHYRLPPFVSIEQILNHEVIATEILRTLIGSIGLALTVPITTFLAAYVYTKKTRKQLPEISIKK